MEWEKGLKVTSRHQQNSEKMNGIARLECIYSGNSVVEVMPWKPTYELWLVGKTKSAWGMGKVKIISMKKNTLNTTKSYCHAAYQGKPNNHDLNFKVGIE